MIRVYFLIAILVLLLVILHNVKVIERNMRNKHKGVEDFDIDSVMVEENTFEDYQLNLKSNIAYLEKRAKDLDNVQVRDVVKKVTYLLCQIYRNTDDTEFNKGNLQKLNTYYIATFVKLLEKYIGLENIKGADLADANDLREKMVGEFGNFVEVFQNLLKESISSDLVDASVEMNVFNQMAVQNGVLEGTNVLKSNK